MSTADVQTKKAVSRTESLINRIFPQPRSFSVRLWNGQNLAASDENNFTLVLNNPGALRRIFKPPIEVSMGEAFIHGDIDVEGDLVSAYTLLGQVLKLPSTVNSMLGLTKELLLLPKNRQVQKQGRDPLKLKGKKHSSARDTKAIQYHYDVGNDFYSLWLDSQMVYSCAYFMSGNDDLDTAQKQKLDYICRKLRLQHGDKLLDIGCGWGGLAMHAARYYGAEVLGVTLSRQQEQYANDMINREGFSGQVSVQLKDYRQLKDGSFDKIVSVGMFEHVGYNNLPEYFSQVNRLLKSGGLFLNHGISCWPTFDYAKTLRSSVLNDFISRKILGVNQFSQHYIFPDAQLVPLGNTSLCIEQAGFEIRDVENLREHYALTIRHWVNRLKQNKDELIRLTNKVTYRTWFLYLSGCIHGFEKGNFTINQILMSKPNKGKCYLPLTRNDLYA